MIHDISPTFALRTPRHQEITEVHGEYPVLFRKVDVLSRMMKELPNQEWMDYAPETTLEIFKLTSKFLLSGNSRPGLSAGFKKILLTNAAHVLSLYDAGASWISNWLFNGKQRLLFVAELINSECLQFFVSESKSLFHQNTLQVSLAKSITLEIHISETHKQKA